MTTTRQLPAGRISLMFTDIEDSSRMNNILGDAVYSASIREPHNVCIRAAVVQHNGALIKTMGDGCMLAFDRASNALACAVALQKSLADAPLTALDATGNVWTVRIRIGVHTAIQELFPDDRDDYHGADVNFAARVESLGTGGQIIVSESTYTASRREPYQWQEWPGRRIRSFDQPETVWELLWDETLRGEPGARWLPAWYQGERNRYTPRSSLQDTILKTFAIPQLDGSTPRLVTLHGFGGMGKTRLAVACATQAAGRFKDGVFFIPFETKPKPKEAIAAAIAAALGLGGDTALPTNLLHVLRDKEMLLILDNYETVDSDEVRAYLADLLNHTRLVHLLITGREAAKLIDVEQLIDLDTGMTMQEAVGLFVTRAQLKKGRHWQPNADEMHIVEKILTLTECIPVAIELATAWTDKRTLAEIAEDLEATPLGATTAEPPRSRRTDTADRHRSLTRCLDWSFDLLEGPAQEGFTRLGVFADTFTAHSVASICGVRDAQGLLDRLQDASLVRRTEVEGYSSYAMHRFTRAYAAQKLDAHPDACSIRQRLIAYGQQLVGVSENSWYTQTQNKSDYSVSHFLHPGTAS